MSDNRPVRVIRLGSIEAAVFRQQQDGRSWHNVNLARHYKHDGTWKTTSNFGLGDLANVADVARRAADWILAEEAKN